MAYVVPQKMVSFGGRNLIGKEVDDLIILHAVIASAGSYSSLRAPNGTTGYLTTGALKIIGYKLQESETTSVGYFQLLYGDTSVLNTTAPTTPVYMTGAINIWSSGAATGGGSGSALEVNPAEGILDFTVPTSKYPAVLCAGGVARVTFFCTY
ncbi:MAG: hypothetical protein H0X02_05850 [Nitrosomonas sp.]|nr:hypothetical protein [Nitrosomonas sp.]